MSAGSREPGTIFHDEAGNLRLSAVECVRFLGQNNVCSAPLVRAGFTRLSQSPQLGLLAAMMTGNDAKTRMRLKQMGAKLRKDSDVL